MLPLKPNIINTTMETTLIRHGKPTYELTGKASAREINLINDKYNQSEISDKPPQHSKQKALTSKIVVYSKFRKRLKITNLAP